MNAIHEKAEQYWAAKEQEKQRQEKARNAAILRAMNAESEKYQTTLIKLTAARMTLIAAIAFNVYAAANGWGLL